MSTNSTLDYQTKPKTGGLACSECGARLSDGISAHKFVGEDELAKKIKTWPIGKVFAEDSPFFLEIDGTALILPLCECLVIGRVSSVPGEIQPDVDLNGFDAEVFGVSRRHATIIRRADLIYIADLGSRNGTFVNERRLRPRVHRLIHNRDEVRLGQLKLRIEF